MRLFFIVILILLFRKSVTFVAPNDTQYDAIVSILSGTTVPVAERSKEYKSGRMKLYRWMKCGHVVTLGNISIIFFFGCGKLIWKII